MYTRSILGSAYKRYTPKNSNPKVHSRTTPASNDVSRQGDHQVASLPSVCGNNQNFQTNNNTHEFDNDRLN